MLNSNENSVHQKWFEEAAKVARNSRCQKAHCGAILVANDHIIGTGFNSPSGGEAPRCLDTYIIPENNKYNITCCIHAEVRAIHDAIKNSPYDIANSVLYFMRIDNAGQITKAGIPYCTICSSEALDSGVNFFALWHTEELGGITLYPTKEYNNISYNYFKDPTLWQLK